MDNSVMELMEFLFDLLFAAFGILFLFRGVSMACQLLSAFQQLCGGQV